MEESPETISEKMLPQSNISTILKSSLPEGIKLSKDVKKAMTHSATIFIMYITSIASEIAHESQGKKKKAVVSPDHLAQALEEMEFRNISEACKVTLKRKK